MLGQSPQKPVEKAAAWVEKVDSEAIVISDDEDSSSSNTPKPNSAGSSSGKAEDDEDLPDLIPGADFITSSHVTQEPKPVPPHIRPKNRLGLPKWKKGKS